KRRFQDIQLIIIDAEDSNKYSFLKRLYKSIVFAFTAVAYALRNDYQVVISSSGPLTIGLPGLAGKLLRKKKFVFEVRDLWPQGSVELQKLTNPIAIKLAYWFEGVCYKQADLVVPCSVDMERSIKQRYPQTHTLVIPNASDSSFYIVPHENPKVFPDFVQGKHIMLYAGSLGLMDDCMQIVEAARLLKNKDIAIVFAGEGAERSVLERACQKYALKNVFFTGLLPKTDIIKWFYLSTASLVTFKDLPVLSSNSPNKLFDSFAAGVPVIQTTRGWIKDLVNDAHCGINACPNDYQNLANAMDWMVDNPEARDLMAANALDLAKTQFNRDKLAREYILAIDNMVDYKDKYLLKLEKSTP
ncbi:MAG: glycosyltransferase family 4 protein, partial [Schleiferiaceae bacterium]|nr:glycosyltransferase family 4 protein [Schleiferiaceae bacterium]